MPHDDEIGVGSNRWCNDDDDDDDDNFTRCIKHVNSLYLNGGNNDNISSTSLAWLQ